MDEILIGTLLASTLRVATPLIFCALAGVISERSGVIDIGLEGKMLAAAFAAGAVGALSGSTALALTAALGASVLLSMLHGYACVSHRGDQVVAGMAINIFIAGITVVLGIAWFSQGGQTPALPDSVRLHPLIEHAGERFGPLLGSAVLGHNILVYLSLALVVAVWWFLQHSTPGLRLRAVGENPHMIDAAGISVKALRYQALALNGILCGLAGSYLVLAMNAAFSPHMTAGRGYMALAAMIFGKWRPLPALAACLLFGFLDAIAIRLQGVVLPGIGEVPVQLIQALPYLLTVILLAGFMGRAIAPRALGTPYVKER
ncbi:ABC transporter permease [Uliginosibacterium sediminicola]|uniref:ABC transporter permease n=1 Tax=Uliginosibacterium sediminicola TaxID=2024550 RepID=A0ABU9YZ80_9RHOO